MLQRNLSWIVALIAALPVVALASSFLIAPALYEEDLASEVVHRDADWTTSETCRSCHPDQHASWARTFHSTMTQEATPQSVQGAFDGQTVTYWGVSVRPVREDDRFFMEYLTAEGRVGKRLEVVRTVGSRRYQQYLVKAAPGEQGENYYRIPLLWHIGEERWIHLNGAFLGSDHGQTYDSHTTIWNQNCIFCHNTGPEPGSVNWDDMIARAQRGERINSATASRYESTVAELGISCESCHAPGGEHAERNRNPLRRYLLHFTEQDDPSIVHPAKLSQERSVEVCGQCHGQRLPNPPDTIREWMHTGPPYRAGEDLTETITSVSVDTPGPAHMPDMFSRRFWQDGTPRLTAYEYQGVKQSPCYQMSDLTCMSCHVMHGGDVRGQIEPEMRTNIACAECHADLVDDLQAHTKHAPESSGSLCYDCHMPKIMYGVLSIHRVHRIHNPDPTHDVEHARPNACTNCHLDKTALWAAEQVRDLWGGKEQALKSPPQLASTDTGVLLDAREDGDLQDLELVEKYRLPQFRGDGAPLDVPSTEAALFAGDPVQRAVAARLAGREGAPLTAQERAWLWPVLLQVMKDDYPTIRYFARLSLQELDEVMALPGAAEVLEEFDYIASAPRRERWVKKLDELWAAFPKDDLPPPPEGSLVNADYQLDMDRIAPLLVLQSTKEIHIGE